jgi:hypothetical protein
VFGSSVNAVCYKNHRGRVLLRNWGRRREHHGTMEQGYRKLSNPCALVSAQMGPSKPCRHSGTKLTIRARLEEGFIQGGYRHEPHGISVGVFFLNKCLLNPFSCMLLVGGIGVRRSSASFFRHASCVRATRGKKIGVNSSECWNVF